MFERTCSYITNLTLLYKIYAFTNNVSLMYNVYLNV